MKREKRKKDIIIPYIYLLPSTIIMVAILGFPIIYNLGISFFDWNLRNSKKTFNGIENYKALLSDEKFLKILVITVVWTLLGVVLQMVFGIALALFVDYLTKGKKFMRTVLLLPWIIPGIVTALMWKFMLQADMGIVNYILTSLHLTNKNVLFLSDTNIALFTLIGIHTWKATPFWFLMITASLQSKPLDQIEAACVDGAKYRHIFKAIILPHLSPIIASTGVLTTIWTLNYFDLIWSTTKGGPMNATSTLPIYTYRLAFEFNDFGQSAAMAVISLILISIMCIPYIKKMFANLKYEGVL